MVPRHLPKELWDALAFVIMQVGERFAGSVRELGQESSQVLKPCVVFAQSRPETL